MSKVLFRSTFLASRICLKSLEHLSLNIHLIYEKFPKNLKHKYLTVITFFFTHTFKKLMSSVYTQHLSILARSIPHPGWDISSLHFPYLMQICQRESLKWWDLHFNVTISRNYFFHSQFWRLHMNIEAIKWMIHASWLVLRYNVLSD